MPGSDEAGDRLGEGAYGAVYRAIYIITQGKRAVKLLQARPNELDFTAHIQAEAPTLERLNHT